MDPQVAGLLAQLEALGAPYEEMTAAEARRTYGAVVAARRGPGYQPIPVGSVTDRIADTDAGAVQVRIYRPAGDDLPVLVYFHGGGWVLGDVDTHDDRARLLCAGTGAVVVSVDYRLAPEDPFPAALEDAHAATRWAAGMGRVAVVGDSAGGNLAAAVCLLAREAGGPPIVAQALVYPTLDATLSLPSVEEFAQGYGMDASTMRWFVEQYLPDPEQRREPLASPLAAADLSGLPPAVVATAEYDILRDEGEAYAERLRSAGVPVTLRRHAGLVHGYLGMAPLIDAAQTAVDELCADLRAMLANRA
jgi:acetyl esterase